MALLLGALVGGCRSAARSGVAPDLEAPVRVDSAIHPPVVRVAVRLRAERASLGADAGVRVAALGARSGARLSLATFVSSQPPGPTRFEVQVASLASPEAARDAARRAEGVAGVAARVVWDEGVAAHRVRVGPFATRAAATWAAEELSQGGFPGAWVAEAGAGGTGTLRLLEQGRDVSGVLVTPDRPGDLIRVDGQPYRGVMEVRADPRGGVTVVNVVNLEEYLRGVVPNELPPDAFPQLEALKAQAVAARTYAVRHRGESAAYGYDLCATPACQVYAGQSSERPLSDRAVEETRGVVATYRGRPIDAFYTSTCGGHTEDGWNLFGVTPDQAPYLRGVACVPERDSWSRLAGSGSGLGLEEAFLIGLGVELDDRPAQWGSRVAAALGRSCGPSGPDPVRRGAFFAHVVRVMCWSERLRLLPPGDVDHALPGGERWESDEERASAALLLQAGVLRLPADGRLQPEGEIAPEDARALLGRAAISSQPTALREGIFRGLEGGRLRVALPDGRQESVPFEVSQATLFRGGRHAARAEELSLAPGDSIRYVVRGGRVAFLEALDLESGQAWDRSSRYHRWVVRATPTELAETAREQGWAGGPIRDVIVQERGASGRVIRATLVGEQGAELELRGLAVRRALGLRETLFAVERERTPDGGIARFVFSGRGWGHGVGLCQVGAFGMAQVGARFDQILGHYYPGVELRPAP